MCGRHLRWMYLAVLTTLLFKQIVCKVGDGCVTGDVTVCGGTKTQYVCLSNYTCGCTDDHYSDVKRICIKKSEDPCDATDSVILPKSKSCLVYDNMGKTWVDSAQVCERNGGDLYRLTNGQLRMEQNVRDCLEAHPTSTGKMDFWIGVTGKWTPQWYWINGDMLSPLATCAASSTGLSTRSNDICRKYLSIDHCVSVCKKEGAEYVAVVHDMTDPCCWCSARATPYPTTCPADRFRFGRSYTIWIYRTFYEQDSGILLDTSDLFTLDTLCGIINESTVIRRELSSQPCFTKNAYICNLGSTYRPCKFFLNDDCVWFGEDRLNWVEAQAECQRKGGNLVSAVKDLDNFELFQPHVKGSHWIGASNYYWDSKPLSNTFGFTPDLRSVACGHMHNEDGVGKWDWSDAKCDTNKPFVCKYKFSSKNLDANAAFRCPWPVGRGGFGGVTPNTTIVKLPTSSDNSSSTKDTMTASPPISTMTTMTVLTGDIHQSIDRYIAIAVGCMLIVSVLIIILLIVYFKRKLNLTPKSPKQPRYDDLEFHSTETNTAQDQSGYITVQYSI